MHPDIDLNRLRIFKEVVQAGSFSKAAVNLRQPKSRVSRQIAASKRMLGYNLYIEPLASSNSLQPEVSCSLTLDLY